MEDDQSYHNINLETGNPVSNALSDEDPDDYPQEHKHRVSKLLRLVLKLYLAFIIPALILLGVILSESANNHITSIGFLVVLAVFVVGMYAFLLIMLIKISLKKHLSRESLVYAFAGTVYLLIVQNLLLFLTFYFVLPAHTVLSTAISVYINDFLFIQLAYFIIGLSFALLNANILDSLKFSTKIIDIIIGTIGAQILFYISFVVLIFLIGFYFLIFPSHSNRPSDGLQILVVWGGVMMYAPLAIAFFLLSIPFLIPKLLENKIRYLMPLKVVIMLFFAIIPALCFLPFSSNIEFQIRDYENRATNRKHLADNPMLYPTYMPSTITKGYSLDSEISGEHDFVYKCSDPEMHKFHLSEGTTTSAPLTGKEFFMQLNPGVTKGFPSYKITMDNEDGFVQVDSKKGEYHMFWKNDGRLFSIRWIFDTCFLDQAKVNSMSEKDKEDYVVSELIKIAESIK